jgi:hypothetical protein
VMYQCQYFAINSSMSQCDYNCETTYVEPEIGMDGSRQTGETLAMIGPARHLASTESVAQVLGWIWKQPDLLMSSKSARLAADLELLVTICTSMILLIVALQIQSLLLIFSTR